MRTLSAPDRDIRFEIVSELEAVRQRIQQRLRFWRGEWFLDATEGVPYLTDLLGDRLDTGLVESVVRDQILSIEDVESISNLEVVQDERSFRVGVDIQTVFGSTSMETDI